MTKTKKAVIRKRRAKPIALGLQESIRALFPPVSRMGGPDPSTWSVQAGSKSVSKQSTKTE